MNARCPCCDHLTLPERGRYDICPICFWEDDGGDGYGPNGVTLAEGRESYRLIHVSEQRFADVVRQPTEAERAELKTWYRQLCLEALARQTEF